MLNRSSKSRRPKKPTDIFEKARSIVDQATGEASKPGRLGGKKGGKARAAKLTKEQRAEVAKRAAARWKRSSV